MSRANQPRGTPGKKGNGQPPKPPGGGDVSPPQAHRPNWIEKYGTPLNLIIASVGAFVAAGTVLWMTSAYVATARTEMARMNQTIENLERLLKDQAERLTEKGETVDRLELRVRALECTSRGAEFDFGALSCVDR